ncbi:MAG: Fic family protein [Syntrophotaleaceae bacterium]
MDTNKFGPQKSGELYPIQGVSGATHAFIPAKLPINWKWPEKLWPLLVEARTALASLDGVGKHLPNPQLLLRPLQNREALRSSSLEGTYSTPEQQLLFQIDPQYPKSEADPVNAQREIFNYGKALRLRFEAHDDLPLSQRLIRELHKILLDGVRGSDSEPGEFRRVQVQIGRPPRFVPPPHHFLKDLLDDFEKYLHSEKQYDPLVESFISHYQFETIHPFRDGNGRVGRLLLSLTIAEWCNLSSQWLYMSSYYDSNKDEYIDRLFNVSSKGDWKGWIEFCLKGVVETAKDTEGRCDKLLKLGHSYKERINEVGGSYRLQMILDDLFISPVVTIPWIAKKHDVTYPTAKSDVDKLLSAGILIEFSDAPQKTFYSPEIVQITYQE